MKKNKIKNGHKIFLPNFFFIQWDSKNAKGSGHRDKKIHSL